MRKFSTSAAHELHQLRNSSIYLANMLLAITNGGSLISKVAGDVDIHIVELLIMLMGNHNRCYGKSYI